MMIKTTPANARIANKVSTKIAGGGANAKAKGTAIKQAVKQTVKAPVKASALSHPPAGSAPIIPLPRETKKHLLRMRLEEPGGASLAALMAATGWQAHTIRAALSGLRKEGLTITRR